MIVLKGPIEFEWDEGNQKKTIQHGVGNEEAEDPFFDNKKAIFKDKKHSTLTEPRYVLLGNTKKQRLLYVIFTIRKAKVRIITARDINRKEVRLYEKAA